MAKRLAERETVMGKAVSRGQALQVSARVGIQVNWDELDGDRLQTEVIDLTPDEFGRRVTAFLKNGARLVVGTLKANIDRSKKFDPTAFIGAGSSIWKGHADSNGLEGDFEQDNRSLAFNEIDMNQVRLVSTLKRGESFVKGEEKLKRLQAAGHIRLDVAVFLHLWLNQHLIPESWKERVKDNIQFIYFDGTVLRDSRGRRYVLYLYWVDGKWYWNVRWLDDGFDQDGVSAVIAS